MQLIYENHNVMQTVYSKINAQFRM
jgi:hypothetical protein